MALLAVRDLSIEIDDEGLILSVINNVAFEINSGQTLGLVGESGCGKSMLALAVIGLLAPGVTCKTGSIRLQDEDLLTLSPQQRQQRCGRDVAIIFQEPMTALNPVMTIGAQIAEAILCHEEIEVSEARKRVLGLLTKVRIPDARRQLSAYPHELSGGMRQRVMIAMALACNPVLLIADEPTTALDVTVQGQILALLAELQREYNMALLLISHDLGLIAQNTERIMVMYRGSIVESGTTASILSKPQHPYTAGLIECTVPLDANCDKQMLQTISGRLPALGEPISGCPFNPRCKYVKQRCQKEKPQLEATGPQTGKVSCFFPIGLVTGQKSGSTADINLGRQ